MLFLWASIIHFQSGFSVVPFSNPLHLKFWIRGESSPWCWFDLACPLRNIKGWISCFVIWFKPFLTSKLCVISSKLHLESKAGQIFVKINRMLYWWDMVLFWWGCLSNWMQSRLKILCQNHTSFDTDNVLEGGKKWLCLHIIAKKMQFDDISSLVVTLCLLLTLIFFMLFFRRCIPKVWSWPVPSDRCEDSETTSLRLSLPSGPLYFGLKKKVHLFQ